MRGRIGIVGLAALLACALSVPISQAAKRHSASHVTYRGKSAQGRPIRVSTSPGRITLIHFKAKLLCRDGSLLFGDASEFEPTRLKRGGRFADVQYGKTDVVSWKGRASRGKKVVGTLEVKDRLQSGVRCDSGPVRFMAKRKGR